MTNIYNYKFNELENMITEAGVAKFRAKQIWNWLYVQVVSSFDEMTNLDKKTIDMLKSNFEIEQLAVNSHLKDVDGTQKALLKLQDGKLIETVLMKYKHGYSVCVTTQVGCAVGCSFCASGLNGLDRNLSAAEIVEQILFWQRILKQTDERVSHVVVMGIGEPFQNYENLLSFIDIINDGNGLKIGARHITVSTSGIVPKIIEFANYDKQVNLAISLHSADDEIRTKIMKINKAYPIDQLMDAVKIYQDRTNRRVSFEYIMLKNINDRQADASSLAQLLRGLNCHVNLIPYNSVDENMYETSPIEKIKKFEKILLNANINVTIRQSKGKKIDGACGQLRNKIEKDQDDKN